VDFEHYLPIVAAPVGGHGRADWGNWARLQLRDQNGDDAGEWLEMGRGSRFRYRKADGSIGTGYAVYVGFSDKPNHGRFYIKGIDGIEEGVYDLDAGSVDPVKFYFTEGTKFGDYLENYYKTIGRNLEDIDAKSKLPVVDFSTMTPGRITEEEANRIKPENRMPPPRNLDEELKSRTESATTASQLQVGDIVFDEALNRYGSVEVAEPSSDGSGNVDIVVRWSNNQVQELTNLPADQQIKVWPEKEEVLVDRKKKKKAEKESVTKDPSELQEGDKVLVDGEEKTVVKKDEALKVWGTNEDGEEISVIYAYDQDLADALEANEDGTLQLEDEDNGLITVEVHSPITRVFVEEDEEPLEYASGETAEMAPTEAVAAEPDDSQAVEPTKAEYDSAIENGRPTFIFNLKPGDVLISSTGEEFLFVSSKRLESKDGLVPFQITVQDSNGELKTFNTKGDKVVAKHEPLQTKNPKYKEFDIRQLKVVNKKSELKAEPTEPAKQEEAADEKQVEVVSQKEVGDLKPDDIVVIDGKTYAFIEAKEINDDNGEFLGLELTLEDFNGNDVIPKTLFQYEDVLDIASELSDRTVKQSGTAKSKKTSEPKEVPAPQDAKPGSSGKLDSRVKYTVLESGRAVHFSYGVDKTNHAARNAKIKKAIDELSKTLGTVLFYYYNGSGEVFTNREGDKRAFSDPEFNKAGYVLELLPGEKDSPNSILTKALKAIHAELAKPDQEEEEVVAEGEAFSGSRSSNGQIAEGVSYAIDDSGVMTLSGNIPGGAEELSDYLNDAFPNGDIDFDPEGFPPTIYSFPSDSGKENELRSKILDEIKKFIESKTSKPSEAVKPEPEAEEEKPTEEEAAEPLQRSYDVLKAAQDFFMQQVLSSPEARAYLEGRKISLETAKNLGIGFAPKDKSALYKHLASLGFTREEMMSVGLVAESDDQTPYDRFRSRILFPFKDSEGRVVGFNGRDITGKADAKYMLTAGPNPADPKNKSVFKKSEVVFNLDNAAEAAKKSGQLIIVEGPFDLLAYREAGFENVIAMSGSDIKQGQIDLIKNAVGEDVDIILSYDLDAAGQKATKLSHDLFTEAGYKTYTANDSSGDKDPADILLDGGPDALKSIVLNKKRVGGVTDDQLAEFTRLVSEYPDAFSPEELRQLAESIVDSSKETADTILNDLKERIEISPLRNELDALVNQAVKNGVILDLERSKIDYKISASQDKKQAIKDAIEKLKEKIQKATPPAKKTEISQGQRDSINRRLSMGVVTQEQRDAIVSILNNPELSKDDVSRVIQTLDLAEHIWRMDNGWAIDPEKGVVLSLKPVVDLGATPDEVYQRMKTYKPTKDVNGKDLPAAKPAEGPQKPEESPEQKFGRLVSTLLEQLTQGGPADRTLSEEDANALVRDILKKLELNPNLKNDSAFLDKVLNRLANDANKNASTGGDWIPHLTKQNVESAFNDAIRDAGGTLEEKPSAAPAGPTTPKPKYISGGTLKENQEYFEWIANGIRDGYLTRKDYEEAIDKLLSDVIIPRYTQTNELSGTSNIELLLSKIKENPDILFKVKRLQSNTSEADLEPIGSELLYNAISLLTGPDDFLVKLIIKKLAETTDGPTRSLDGAARQIIQNGLIDGLKKHIDDFVSAVKLPKPSEYSVDGNNNDYWSWAADAIRNKYITPEEYKEMLGRLFDNQIGAYEFNNSLKDTVESYVDKRTKEDANISEEDMIEELFEIILGQKAKKSYDNLVTTRLGDDLNLDKNESLFQEFKKKTKEVLEGKIRQYYLDFKQGQTSTTPATAPTVEEGRRLNDRAIPSNLGTKTGTNALPQTGDNFNADGTPAYAPSTGPFRGTKFRAMVSEAYRLGGWKAVKDLIQRSNVVAFDTETTGIEEYDGQLKPGNRLVQLGASRVNKDGEVERFNIYINPETGVIMSDWSKDNLLRPELDENGNPTGNFIKIEKDWLDQQSDEKAALEQFIKFLGDDVVLLGHNLNFDISVLQEALDRHNLSINALGSMDTMDFAGYSLPTYNPTGKTKSGKDSRDGVVLDGPKRPDPNIKPEDLDPNNPLHFQSSKKLGDVLQYFGLEPAGWHRADADAEDSYRILENILDWLIANPGRESSNALGIKALEFEKINGVADKEIGRYLNAIGSGRPATSRQTSLNPVNAKGKPTPGFATDLRKMEVSEDQIKNILAPMTGMTRGQAAEYIASILADLRAGNEPDTKKALQTAGFTPRTARPSNAIPDAANQEAGTVEHEVSKNAADLAIGDKVRRDGSDVYGTIKSIDRSTAGIIKITVAYDDGETLDISMKPSKKVAVYEEDNPKDATASEPQQESEVDTTSEAPDQNPTTAPAPEPTVVEPEEQEEAKPEGQQQAEPEEETVVIDISSYPAQDREGIREFIEIVDKLNSMEGKESNIKVVESGKQNGLVERTPKFIEAFASKEEIEKALTDLGISKLKARRIAKKLQNLEGKEKYFAELRKINEELAKEQRNKKSFGRVEKIMDFGDFLRMRGYPQGRELQLSGDPRDRAAWSKEYDLYWAWRDSLKKRGKTKTISDGNVSVTYSADEADEAQRLLDSTKKLQEEFPLDGRKLKVSVYSPEQLAILDIGDVVGASIVTDKLAHIAVSSSVVGRKELDPRENGSGEKDYSDLFTIIHEYGHVYDEIALNGNTRDKFVKQFKDSNITIYAEENMAERFAEHFMDLAYSKLKGQEPVSGEFKKFIEDGQESGDIDPTVLKKGGPFFGDEIVNPRRISAIVQGENIRGVGEKVESELQDFENATNTGNGTLGAWLKGSDDEAGYIPDLSKDEVAKKYTDSVGVSKEEFSSLSEKDKAKVLEDVRKLLQPLVDAQRQDSRKYRVMTVDGTNVHVRFKEGSVDAKTLSDLVDELKALDNFSDMGGMPVIVTLADNNTFSVKGEFLKGTDAGYNVLNSSGTQMHIVLNTKYKNEPSEPEPNDRYRGPVQTTAMLDTLVHEYLGHGLARIFFGQRTKTLEVDHERFEEFKRAFPLPDDPKDHPVSEYGGDSHNESFAEYVRAAYALVKSGESPYNYPEILKFLQFIDERIGKYGPVRKTDKAGSDLALVDRRVVGETSRFPQPKKYYGELAAIDTYNNRDVYYSNNLDPYGRPVGSDFTETLEEAYSLVAKARDEYYADPSTTNFYKFAALASTINEIYDSRYFNYPKGNPRFTDQSILDNITTSSDASSMRRWQADKPFVPLRYPSTAEKFNNEMVVSTYTDPNGDVYQVAFISSKPAGREDAVSESAHVFVSKPNQPLSEFIDSGTTFNDLVKKSVGQMKIANFEKDNLLAQDELEIQGTYVDGRNRRKGVATAMLAIAKQNSPKYLRFSRQQTIQEDSWARAVDQNKENHLGLPAFTDPDGGLHPADRSPLISPAVGYRNTDPNVAEVPVINRTPNVGDRLEEEAFDAHSGRYLASSVFAGSRDYYSANGGGLGLDQSVVGAVRTDALSSMAGNEVDEARVLEIMEKIKSGEGFKDPVIVYYDPETGNMVVADGNHHVEASKRLGIDLLPTRVITGKFDPSEYLSVKKSTKEWKAKPFESKKWPTHVNPYFIFESKDLIGYEDDDVIIDKREIKKAIGKVEPDEISKLIGRYVIDNVTGQVYMVYDEHYDPETGEPTGKIIVERLVGTFDVTGDFAESRVNGKLTFNSDGKLLMVKGGSSLNQEYNDIRQYELEIKDLSDFSDVTESFIKSGGMPLVVTESMFYVWSGRDIKGRINRFLSPGKVELAELIGVKEDGENQYELHEVPVSELGLIQRERESLSETPVDHSEDMLAGNVLYGQVISVAKSLLADGFLDRSFFAAILETVKGRFQTRSGVEDMLESLRRLNKRRIKQKREEVLKEKLETATTKRAVIKEPEAEAPAEAPKQEVVKGRMTFKQLYDQAVEDKKNGVKRDPFTDTKSPATEESSNPLSKPDIDAVAEIAIILAELTGIDSRYGFTEEETKNLLEALKTASKDAVNADLQILRARVLRKRQEYGQPIGDLILPDNIDKEKMRVYTPDFNMDGTDYTGPEGTTFSDDEIYGEKEEIIDYIKYVLSPGDFLAITGGAGTGKTTIIRQLIKNSRNTNLAVVSPTGTAARNVGPGAATTIHSLFGFDKNVILSGEFDVEIEDEDENGNPIVVRYTNEQQFVSKYAGTKKGKALAKLDLLVIDEVSMVNANLMDAMDLALRVAKGKMDLPFGGTKVVAFGDDNQLPPVEFWNPDSSRTRKLNDDLAAKKITKEEYDAEMRVELDKKAKHEYMLLDYNSYRWFDSKVFAQQKPLHHRLEKIYRQKDDLAFAELLKRLANTREITQEDIDFINSRYGYRPEDPNALRIVLTNKRADAINKQAIEKLQQEGSASLDFTGTFKGLRRAFKDDDLHAPEKITYYIGEKVVFTVNDGKDLRDQVGFRGATRWSNGTQGTVVGFDEERGLPIVEIMVERADGKKEPVQVVVGRATSTASGASSDTVYDEISGSPQERFSTKTEAEYTQIPLMPAYAITVHKSQGMTISGEATIDFLNEDGKPADVFAAGQAYVALSRFTDLKNVFLTRKITAADFISDNRVEEYYAGVEDIEIGDSVQKAKKEKQDKAASEDSEPTVDRRQISGQTTLFKTVSKADLKTAKDILGHKTKPIRNLPSDWGTKDLFDHFFSEFGYGDERSFKENLKAIMSEKVENLHLEQKLLVSLIAAHGKADIYEHAESGTVIKRHLEDGIFSNKDASDNEVVRAANAHKLILNSGYVIDGGRMDINLRDLSYIKKNASGMYSASKDEINLDRNEIYGWAIQGKKNQMSQDEQFAYVLAHEYGHALDNKFAEDGLLPRLSEVLENLIKSGMQNRAKEILRGYALSSSPEYFAESYAGLILQSVLNQLGYSDETIMDEALISEIKNQINLRNAQE